ncbi:MAG: glycoside hydrolase family 10 protein [Ruminococcus sp.]
MRFLKLLPTIIAVVLLCTIIGITGTYNKNTEKPEEMVLQTSSIKNDNKEMRGVWVTYMDLNMEDTDKSYKAFKEKFNKIANTAKKDNFNTLIVQVRPFSDALYDSAYYPYSHILTGTQGKDPGYDPLKYMCEYSHKIGLDIHAWVNPYRVKINESPKKLSENNPYNNNKRLGVKVGNDIYYNPALEDVRLLIEFGIKEIVKNYDVDGIQFDDYFYPTQSKSFDEKEYNSYVKSVGAGKAISLKNWRIANVNILVAETYSLIHSIKENVVFGISPQGNINNDYDLYADVKSWCSKSGYVDYICPQLYYSIENPALKYEDAINNWLELEYSDEVTLYIGIAGYKTGTNSDNGTWLNSDNILQKEVKLLRKKGVKGFMFYSYLNLESEIAAKEVSNLVKILD